jgi:large exoprotein involved in heme utilization and adhesion
LGISTRLGQSLQIVGGDILVDGGRFSAIDGSLSLLALGAGTTARLRRNDNGYIAQPIRPVTITDAGTIHLENGALLSASGHWQGTFERDDPGGASGGIQIYADNFNLQDSIVKADTSSGIGHDSVINANHLLISGLLDPSQIPGTGGISRNAGIYINAYAVGQSGDLYLNSETLQIERSGIISMDAGNDLSIGGNLWIVANDSIMIGSTDTFVSEFPNNFSVITATLQPGEAPQGGTINIATERLTIANDGRIEIGNQAPSGNPGEIIINADTINIIKRFDSDPILNSFSPIAQGASIETGASSGQSGSIRINSQALTLDGLFAAIVIGSGDGTNTLDINSDDISITNGAQIVSITESDRSAADLRIISQNIELQGTSENGDIPSLIGTQTRAASFNFQESQTNGNAGVLDIRTARLLVEDGAAISVDTFANGNAGELIINSGDTIISGQSDIASETTNVAQIDQFRISPVRNVEGFLPSRITGFTSGAGSGGSVSIVGDRLTVRDGARIEVGANRFQLPVTILGDAGNLQLTADRLSLENGQLLANTESGNTGNIAIASQDLRLRDTSEIRTNATGNSTGGNITIRADTIIALGNSDITADAPLNRGGQIRITAIGILGAALRAQATPFTSDITATSGLGPEFDGVVLLETPNIAIGNGLVDPKLIAAPPLLQNACETQPGERPSEFHIIGRGGLPGTAEQIAELPDLFAYHESRQASPPHLEAHRLQRNRDGMAILLAHQIPLTVPCSLSQQN